MTTRLPLAVVNWRGHESLIPALGAGAAEDAAATSRTPSAVLATMRGRVISILVKAGCGPSSHAHAANRLERAERFSVRHFRGFRRRDRARVNDDVVDRHDSGELSVFIDDREASHEPALHRRERRREIVVGP